MCFKRRLNRINARLHMFNEGILGNAAGGFTCSMATHTVSNQPDAKGFITADGIFILIDSDPASVAIEYLLIRPPPKYAAQKSKSSKRGPADGGISPVNSFCPTR